MNMTDHLEKIIELAREYSIPRDVINAIRKGVEFKISKHNENLSPEEFFDYVEEMLNTLLDEDIDLDDLSEDIKFLFEGNKNICFVKKTAEYDLGNTSVTLTRLPVKQAGI